MEKQVRATVFGFIFLFACAAIPAQVAAQSIWLDKDIPQVVDDVALAVERRRLQAMTVDEHPLAIAERLAHDYVYAEGDGGYHNLDMLRRMKADGLTVMETYTAPDGTAAMVVRDDDAKTPKHFVVFRGTDDDIDNFLNAGEVVTGKPVGFAQYEIHKGVFDGWAQKYGKAGNLHVTGHSRGGGLAALFTASHPNAVSDLTMFQAPGQSLKDHDQFRKSLKGKWPRTTLVVAASDPVQLAGLRHLGMPQVIVAMAKDMILGRGMGHGSMVLQNAETDNWEGKTYRTPGDGLLRTTMDYNTYARSRIHAAANGAHAQQLRDEWLLTISEFSDYDAVRDSIEFSRWSADRAEILTGAQAAYGELRSQILQDNIGFTWAEQETLNNMENMFEHLLPPGMQTFELHFYALFRKMIAADFQAIEAGAREKSAFFLDARTRKFLRDHKVETYLKALRRAFKGDRQSLIFIMGPEVEKSLFESSSLKDKAYEFVSNDVGYSDRQTQYALRTLLLRNYYEVQKQALYVLEGFFAAGEDFVLSGLRLGLNQLSELGDDLDQYILDSDTRNQIREAAQTGEYRPKPKPASPPAIETAQDLTEDSRAAGMGQVPDVNPLLLCYELVHADLFADALSYPEFLPARNLCLGLSDQFWRTLESKLGRNSNREKNEIARRKKDFFERIGRLDESYFYQAESKLARLDLLYDRFTQADIADLVEELEDEIAQVKKALARLNGTGVTWLSDTGRILGRGETTIAATAPTGAATGLWTETVETRNRNAAERAGQISERISELVAHYGEKATREQDYVLGVLDFYGTERARHGNAAAYYAAAPGGRTFPKAGELRELAFERWLTQLADAMDELLALQVHANRITTIAGEHRLMAEDRQKDIAYFGQAFEALQLEEQHLLRDYTAVATALHQGSSDARNPIVPEWGLGRIYNYAGPLISFNGQTLCVDLYNCDGALDTEGYLYKIGERLRYWQMPPGDTRDNQPSSEIALGALWAYIPEHRRLAGQFVAIEQEVQEKVSQIAPLHAKFLALVGWRKKLEASFKAQTAGKPILKRAFEGKQPFTMWDDVSPVTSRSSYPAGNLPGAYALSSETAEAWGELHVDFTFLTARLAYLQNSFIPKASKLISDISDIEARLRSEVDWRVAEIRRLTQEIKDYPNMPPLVRAEKLDLGNTHVNFVLGTHHGVADLAPFRADFANDAQAAYQALTAIGEPEMETGRVFGSVRDQTGAPLPAASVRLNKVVSGGVGPSASIRPDALGRFDSSGLATGWWQIDITAPGFAPQSETIRVTAFAPAEVVAILVSDKETRDGNLTIVIEHEPGTESTPVEVLVTDLRGKMVATGTGPHILAAGKYVINSYAQYLETDPASRHFEIFAGTPITITISVWQDDEEKDDEPPVTPPSDRPDFSDAVIALCEPNPVFVRSLYQTIMNRDPEQWEIDAHVQQLEKGYTRSYYVRGFLLGDGYANLGKQGTAFYTDAIQSIYGRAPNSQELSAMPRIRAEHMIDELLRSTEHQELTQSCAPLWREDGPDADTDDKDINVSTGQPEPDVGVQQAYQEYIAAYNKLTSLMAKGEGDTKAADIAYQAYLKAKAKYEALEAGEETSDDTVDNPPDFAPEGTGLSSLDSVLLHVRGQGTIRTDAGWKATTETPPTDAWMRPSYDDSGWNSVLAQWQGRPAPATSIIGMEDTDAQWIWHPSDPDLVYFRREFILEYLPRDVTLRITADNEYVVHVNGYPIGRDGGDQVTVWNTAEAYDLTPFLTTGPAAVSVIGRDLGGGSGLLADIKFGGPSTLPDMGVAGTAKPGHETGATSGAITWDFETGDLSGWTKTGAVFDYQPTYGDNPSARGRGQPSNHGGDYWIGGFERYQGMPDETPGATQGDGPTGTLASPVITIPGGRLDFLVGGGDSSDTRVELLVDGKPVLQASGNNSETMVPISWDLQPWSGRLGQIRIVDEATGGWGHVNVDDFRFSAGVPDLNLSGPGNIETAQSPSKPSSPQYASRYLGCYKDTNTRDLNGYFESGPAMSSSQCVAVCAQRGFAYAGTQYGTQCFCGESYGAYGSADNCNMSCSGAADEMCGGFWANSVYAVAVNDVKAAGSRTEATEPVPDSITADDVIAVSETNSPLDPEGPAKAETYLVHGKDLLSQAYWSDTPTARNALFVQALEQLEQAQELGSAEAIYHIGFMYEIGNAVPQDNDIALSYYDAAARGGYAEGYAQAILVMNQLRRYDQAAQTFFAFTKAFPKAAMQGFDDNAYSDQVSKAIQQVLKRAGYYNGAIDGIIGSGTRRAITQYVVKEVPDEVIQPYPFGASGANTSGTTSDTTDSTQKPSSSQAMELAFWTSIEASKDPADFEAYLLQWPDGVFAALALNRLNRLGSIPDSAQSSNQTSNTTAGIYTPVRGSSERSAIMDAARGPVGADLGQPVIFVVDELRSDGEWAYLQAVPKRPDGTSINYAATPFAGAWQQDMMTDLVMVLLRNQNGQMRVVDYVIGPTDVYWYTWVEAYGLPEVFFFPG